ncbi:MAG: hypothetical protein LPK92_12390, partial [Actinomycetes bacterium]|nr:hypothetical protein [Actinomycetes bacterium]
SFVILPRETGRPAICRNVHIPCAVRGPQIPSTGPVGIANFCRIRCASAITLSVDGVGAADGEGVGEGVGDGDGDGVGVGVGVGEGDGDGDGSGVDSGLVGEGTGVGSGVVASAVGAGVVGAGAKGETVGLAVVPEAVGDPPEDVHPARASEHASAALHARVSERRRETLIGVPFPRAIVRPPIVAPQGRGAEHPAKRVRRS